MDKEIIYQKYIIENLSADKVCEYFQIPKTKFYYWTRKFGIKKDLNVIKEKRLSRKFPIPKYNLLYTKYIINNLTQNELSEFFQVSTALITNWLKQYQIYKPTSLMVKACIRTNLKKYGTEFCHQNYEIFEKSQKFKFYSYTLPSGKILKLQGYEKFGIEWLLNFGVDENQIHVGKEVPKFHYFYNGKNRIYFPDLLVDPGHIFEVKSLWTYIKERDQNKLKQQSIRKYTFDFLIFDKFGNEISYDEAEDYYYQHAKN